MEGNSSAPVSVLPELVVELENPISIKSNFPQLKAWLDSELVKYEIEVTSETLQDAKRAAAELSDLAKKLDRARIDYAKKFKAPISEWEAEAKTLFEAAIAAREKIIAQTKVFDDKTREVCRVLMIELLAEEYSKLEVRNEYQSGFDTIPSLVGTSKVTGSGNLTKAARENIENLAKSGRLNQERSDGRMARVEADCRAAGVEPLTRDQVASFLDLEDSVFQPRLAKMIAEEVKRQESAREKIRREEQEKAEREARIKMEAEAKAKAEAEAKAKQEQEAMEAASKANYSEISNSSTPPVQEPKLVPVRVDPPAEASETEEEKKTITLGFRFNVEMVVKLSTDPDRARRVMAPLIAKAIKEYDPRIVAVEVAQ